MMKDFKRNLIYWGRTLEKTALLILVFVWAMWGVLTFMEGGSLVEKGNQELWMYLVMAVFIISFSNAVNSVNTYFPFTVSMGSTRKASFIAMQTIQHLILFEYVILAGGICYFTMRDVFRTLMPYLFTMLGAILLLQAFLNFISLFYTRFGNRAGAIAYILLLIACFGAAVYGYTTGSFEDGEFLNALKNFLKKPYLLGAGVALDVIAAEVYYILLRTKELRF